MKQTFENLKKIFSSYKNSVDKLAESYAGEAAADSRYSDVVIAERKAERNQRYNAEVGDKAARAEKNAMEEIEKLRAAVKRYITNTSDLTTMQTVQAVLAAGVELSDAEADALASGASYMTLKLLSKATNGRITPPNLKVYNEDLLTIGRFAEGMRYYRGDGAMAGIGAGGLFGQNGTMSSAVTGNWLVNADSTLTEMATRWATLGGD